jgi:mRNA interferase MazF
MIRNSVVLVSFPFDDLSSFKVRPAICLTSEIGKWEHVIVAFISSKIPEEVLESDIVVKANSIEWSVTGLAVDSVIRLHRLVSIPKSIIKRKLGEINPELEKEIKRKLKELFYLV